MTGRRERGQALVEFALALPVFLVLLVGIFDLGHVVWANDAMASAAREAARYAMVRGGSQSNACQVGPPADPGSVPAASDSCPYPAPSRQGVKDAASQWLQGVGSDVTVSVCYGQVTTCSNDQDAPGATNARGTPVTVSIRARVSLGAPSLLGIGPFDLSSSTTMIVSH